MNQRFKQFGMLVKKIRIESGLTQTELAKEIGVHSQYISNCERFINALPPSNLEKLVKKLKLNEAMRQRILGALIEGEANDARAKWSKPLGLK
jgi:DNA-binding XRE family transcriptional regulator